MAVEAYSTELSAREIEEENRLLKNNRSMVRIHAMMESEGIEIGDDVIVYHRYSEIPVIKKFRRVIEEERVPYIIQPGLQFELGTADQYSNIDTIEKLDFSKLSKKKLKGSLEEQINKQGIHGHKDEEYFYIVEVTPTHGKKFIGVFLGEPEPKEIEKTVKVTEKDENGEEKTVEKKIMVEIEWEGAKYIYQIYPAALGKTSIKEIRLISKVKRKKIQTREEDRNREERIKRRNRRNR